MNEAIDFWESTIEIMKMKFYDGIASYPNNSSMKFTVQNVDDKVIKTEELWK